MTDSPSSNVHRAVLGVALWLATTVYLICNLGHIQLAVAVSSDAANVAQVYYSRDGRWNEPQSTAAPLVPGRNDVRLGLPGLLTGGYVRFDPGRRAATYRISSVRWIGTGYEVPVPLGTVVNARNDASEVALSANELVLVARDDDPQLLIPTPAWSARIAGALWPLGISLVALVFVAFALRRRIGLPSLAAALLGICALLYFFACLMVGPRLPLADDWRYVLPGPFNLVDGSWQWLGVVGNDTYFLTNQVLDFLVLKFSNADFLWLRGAAVALLLLQLAMQYRVVSRAAQASPAVAAIAVMLGIWSLSAGAYWSGTTIAYQQALPTIFGTAMLVQLVAHDGSIRSRLSLGLLIACCIGSGLSYISGGVLILSLGAAYLLAVDWRRASPSAVRVVAVLIGFGIALLVLQFALVSMQQGSLLQHNHHSESVFPTDRRFWLFFVALYGRALGYGGLWVPADILFTLLALLPAVVLGMQRLRALFRGAAPEPQPTWTLLALYAGIGSASYAAVVAFGRAGFAPADSAATVITAMGKGRFHFWPVAAMLPYAWLGWAALLQRMRIGATVAGAMVGTLMLAPKSLLLLDNVSTLRDIDRSAHDGARCVVAHLVDAEAGRPVVCTTLTSAANDIGPTLMHLRAVKSRLYDEIIEEGTLVPP
jgi:hypothetical protein